jgi:hypothetical protein
MKRLRLVPLLPLGLLGLGACNAIAGLDSLEFRDASGDEVLCAPGETRACYSGPAGTQGVGTCAAGVARCLDDGSGFGACAGEVLPSTESCAAPEDEDCNGQSNDGCSCSPGTSLPCYSGPPGTENVGACHGGTQTCVEGGSGYGPCTGEVVPASEVCLTPDDEDCDAAAECGTVTDGAAYGDGSAQLLLGLGIGPLDEVAFAGQLQGKLVLGMDMLAGSAPGDVLAGRRAAPQTFSFAATYGAGQLVDLGQDAAIADDGSVVVVGSASGPVDFGDGPLVPAGFGSPDAFVAKVGGPPGKSWSALVGDSASQAANAVAVAPNGTVAMVGDNGGSILHGMDTLDSLNTDGFLVGWSPDGSPSFALGLGGGKLQRALDVAFDDVSRAVFVGVADNEIDLEGVVTPIAKTTAGYVVARTLGGGPRWMVLDASADGSSAASAVTTAVSGEIFVAGSFQGSVSFGSCNAASSGGTQLFVLTLSVSGECSALYTTTGTGTQEATGIATDAQGNVYVVGRIKGDSDFGGGLTASGADWDGFVLALSGGQPSWLKLLGGSGDAAPEDVAVTSGGTLVVGGSFQGELDWTSGKATSAGDWDLFFLDIAP